MARPVVGGHFAFLALERACGGKAIQSLEFLDQQEPAFIDVAKALDVEKQQGFAEKVVDEL